MTDKRTVFGVDPENVRQFLDDCLAPPASDDALSETARIEQALQEHLAEKCPVPGGAGRSGSWLLDRVQEKVFLDCSRPVREVLFDERTDLDALREIKDRYKNWADRASDKDVRHVYRAIYFAAIARALVSHQTRITRHRPAYLIHSFQVLADQPWMLPALRELYLAARRACEQRPDS